MTILLKSITGYSMSLILYTEENSCIIKSFEPNETISSKDYIWDDYRVEKYINSNLLTQFTIPAGSTLITFNAPPSIITQPQSLSESADMPTATFNVVASGSEPLSYQWYQNGYPVENWDSTLPVGTATLVVSTASTAQPNNMVNAVDGDQFYVVVSNAYGSVQSETATLSLIQWGLSVLMGVSGSQETFTSDGWDYEASNGTEAIVSITNDPGTGTVYTWAISGGWTWDEGLYNERQAPTPGPTATSTYLYEVDNSDALLTISATIGGVTKTINITIHHSGS